MSRVFWRILDGEARALNFQRRSFLWMLHKRSRGELPIRRLRRDEKWRLQSGDCQASKPYHWTLSEAEQRELGETLKTLGNPPPAPSWYAAFLLGEWLGVWWLDILTVSLEEGQP